MASENAMTSAIANAPVELQNEFMGELLLETAMAIERQGARAMDHPKSAAAAHEAGHVVHQRAENIPVDSCRIFQEPETGSAWLGITDGGGGWTVGPDTTPQNDLQVARTNLAGLMGELVLEREELRAGSSLDELIMARKIVATAAYKLGVNPQRLLCETIGMVIAILEKNHTALLGVGRRLYAREYVHGKQLRRLLHGVTMPSAEEIAQAGRNVARTAKLDG